MNNSRSSSSLDLWKVREYNTRNRQPITVVVFKIFSGSTPTELINELFDLQARDNDLPYCLLDLKTRVDYQNLQNGYFNPKECLVFFKVQGCNIPPRIQHPSLYCYRKAIDGNLFKSALYDKVVRFGWSGKYIDTLKMDKVKEKIKVLEKFFLKFLLFYLSV